MDKFLELLRLELEQELERKTGWGRNELMTAFDKASIKALVKYAREKGINID